VVKLTVSEQCSGVLPFVRLELPCLTRGQNAQDTVPAQLVMHMDSVFRLYSPGVLPEFLQRIDTVHDYILRHDIPCHVSCYALEY
jgi:hypothetical protein